MARLIGGALAVFMVFGVVAVIYGNDWWTRRRLSRRQVIRDEVVVQQAHVNYAHYVHAVQLLQRIVDADEVLPSLSTDLRRDADRVLAEYQKQLETGD